MYIGGQSYGAKFSIMAAHKIMNSRQRVQPQPSLVSYDHIRPAANRNNNNNNNNNINDAPSHNAKRSASRGEIGTIPLKGILLGGPFFAFETQMLAHYDFLFALGFATKAVRDIQVRVYT